MKKKQESMIAVIASAIVSFLFLLASPLHPWNCYDTGTDSGVFKTVAMMMGKGYMPYRDSFDHKGPLLYIINWLGDAISAYRGVWLIEFLFMTAMVFVLYKIARLSCRMWEAMLVAMVSLTLLYSFFDGGNLAEEYAMCFIAVSLFLFIDYLKNNKITRLRLLLCGAAFAGTLLLRPNMIAVWVVMCLTILVKTCREKDWKKLGFFILFFCIGCALVILPVVLWLALNGDFSYFWDAYITFNTEYASVATFGEMWNSFFNYFNKPIFYIAFFAQIYAMRSENKWLNISHLLCMLVSLGFICFSGGMFGHYGMILIPLVAYPFSYVFEEIGKIKTEGAGRAVSMLIGLCLLAVLIMPAWESVLQVTVARYENRNNGKISMTAGTVANYVEANTTPEDGISVYGNWDLIYVLSDRRHATRYSYQFPISDARPEIIGEYLSQLTEEQPKVIVVQKGHLDDRITGFLEENKYELLWSENGASLDGALVYAKQ